MENPTAEVHWFSQEVLLCVEKGRGNTCNSSNVRTDQNTKASLLQQAFVAVVFGFLQEIVGCHNSRVQIVVQAHHKN